MIQNGYCSLDEYKYFNKPETWTTNTIDDAVIERMIEAASRYIDKKTRRFFYPLYGTRYFNVPEERRLYLDADLLELTTLTNGDDTAISSSDYLLQSRNEYPKWAIKLLDSSDESWEVDSNNSAEAVIDVLGWWGCHDDYDRAWLADTTTNEELDASETAITVTAATNLQVGQIIKIESEVCVIRSIATNDVTVIKRGDNGTTAAIHTTGKTVYIWQPIADIKNACMDIVNGLFHRRSGQNISGIAEVTAAGIVITPQDISAFARDILQNYTRVGVG